MDTRTYIVSGDDEASARIAAEKIAYQDGLDPVRIVDVRYRGQEMVNGIQRERFAVSVYGETIPESELRALAGDR